MKEKGKIRKKSSKTCKTQDSRISYDKDVNISFNSGVKEGINPDLSTNLSTIK